MVVPIYDVRSFVHYESRKRDGQCVGIRLFIIKSIKRELKTRPTYDCRCDERLEPKNDESTCLEYTGLVTVVYY
jgi:hypothetical protein